MSAVIDEEPPGPPGPAQIVAALLHSVAVNALALVVMLIVMAPFMSAGVALVAEIDDWAIRVLGGILLLGPLAAVFRVWFRLMVN